MLKNLALKEEISLEFSNMVI